jgi:class 3 adenylate cyclase
MERSARRADAATAADVTALQVFRDLFAHEALRAGDEIEINNVTLMFTDLRDSTRMYRQIGDARHLGECASISSRWSEPSPPSGGAVVKTIGDAVMAVFAGRRRPAGHPGGPLPSETWKARPSLPSKSVSILARASW